MKRYFLIYKRILKINMSALVAYRMNFINSIIGNGIWGVFSVIAALLLTSRTSNVAGWSREDLLFLSAAQSVFIGMFDFFLSRNIDRFPRYVEYGQLDGFLLKPVNERFFISFLHVNYGAVIRFIIGITFLYILVQIYHIQITTHGLILFGGALIISMFLLYGLWFSIITLTIWFTRLSNIVDLLYTLRGASRFPQQVFREASIYLYLLFFPLSILVARPTEIFLQKTSDVGLLTLFITALCAFFLSQQIWKTALRSYTSASS